MKTNISTFSIPQLITMQLALDFETAPKLIEEAIEILENLDNRILKNDVKLMVQLGIILEQKRCRFSWEMVARYLHYSFLPMSLEQSERIDDIVKFVTVSLAAGSKESK